MGTLRVGGTDLVSAGQSGRTAMGGGSTAMFPPEG
jgi:hypothetical protein